MHTSPEFCGIVSKNSVIVRRRGNFKLEPLGVSHFLKAVIHSSSPNGCDLILLAPMERAATFQCCGLHFEETCAVALFGSTGAGSLDFQGCGLHFSLGDTMPGTVEGMGAFRRRAPVGASTPRAVLWSPFFRETVPLGREPFFNVWLCNFL